MSFHAATLLRAFFYPSVSIPPTTPEDVILPRDRAAYAWSAQFRVAALRSVRYLLHVVFGALIFFMVALPSVALQWSTQLIENRHMASPLIIVALKVLAYLMLSADLVLFILFTVRIGYSVAQEILNRDEH